MQMAIPAGGEALARRFYGEVLGLVEIAKPAALAVRGGCWFDGPGFQLHLGVEADFVPARKAHPAFLVADLAAWASHIRGAGQAVIPDAAVAGVRRFYTADPFGNRIEFIQQGDGFRRQAR
jgi:catechol 2,3-dioxygenase-like lactoylglutathione lyase family enzyme